MRQVPLNRYAYYLTRQGFAEKSRLTAEYLAVSFDFFRRACTDYTVLLRQCEARGWRTVALFGAGDLAEIAILSATETAIEVLCVIDLDEPGRRCGGLPVVADIETALERAGHRGLDGIIVTDTRAPQSNFDHLRSAAGLGRGLGDRVVSPSLLRISPIPEEAPP
jgi:hypothetical protein